MSPFLVTFTSTSLLIIFATCTPILPSGQERQPVEIEFSYPFPGTIVDYDDVDNGVIQSHVAITTTPSIESVTVFLFCDGKLVNNTWHKSLSTSIRGLDLGNHTLEVLVLSGIMNSTSNVGEKFASMNFTIAKHALETAENSGRPAVVVTHPSRISLNPGSTTFEWIVVNGDELADPRVSVSLNGDVPKAEVRDMSGSITMELPFGSHSLNFFLFDGPNRVSELFHPAYVPRIRRATSISSTALAAAGNSDGSDGQPGIAIKYPPHDSIFQCHPDLHIVMHYSIVNTSPDLKMKSIVVMDGQAVQETDAKDVSVNLSGFQPGFHEIVIVLAENYTETTQKRGPQIRNKIRFGIEFSHEEGPVVCSIFLPNKLRLDNVPIPEWAMYARAEKRIMGKGVDDGVLETLFNEIDEVDSVFVEFGAGQGLECVTRYLREERAWKGQLFDPDFEDQEMFLAKETPRPSTILDIMEKYKLPAKFDLLVLPSSCAEFHLWSAIGDRYKPRVVLAGFNARIPANEDKVVPFEVTEEAGSFGGFGEACERYVGSSALAMMRLGWSLGYSLVHADTRGQRLYFVNADEAAKCRTKGIDDTEQILKLLRFYPQRGVDPSDPSLLWSESGLGL